MIAERGPRLISLGALAVGVVLFAGTLYYVDFATALAAGRRLGVAVALALLASGAWHLTRTWAWSCCFPPSRRVSFPRLARVRLAAEAFSYLTISGVAGEPLKVVLLGDRVSARDAAAAVALERIAYIVATALLAGAGSILAIATQPLSPVWMKVYRAFAVGSAVLAAAVVLMLVRRRSYLLTAFRAADRAAGTHAASGSIGRFVADVGRQLSDLVRGNPLRLAALTLAAGVAYLCMALEAYLILRAVGVPISFAGAVALETFSRVASFASAFIPAGIGALEASSVGAAAAIGAGIAGAPLALVRRLRGLFWAGVGLAIYPRRAARRAEDGGRRAEAGKPEGAKSEDGQVGRREGPVLLYVPAIDPSLVPVFSRVAGLSIAERVLRSAFRAQYERVVVLADASQRRGLRAIANGVGGAVTIATSEEEWRAALASLPTGVSVTAIGPGTVVSPALLEDAGCLPAAPGEPRDVPAGPAWHVSGVLRIRVEDTRDPALLREALQERLAATTPLPAGEDVSHHRARLAIRVTRAADLAVAEQVIRRSSYKDTDNTLARWNRSLSLPISVALIRTPVTANQFSVALVAIGFYSAWLFSLGAYWPGVLGGLLSLAASVLDGCDGEIARLKYQESALGCWIETFGDYSYYIAIFVGLTAGAVRRTGWEGFYWLGAIALFGTLASFALLIFLRNRITAGRPERLHAIGKQRFKAASSSRLSKIIWRVSFVATRSAMPYGIFALSLVGLLPLVVFLAAIGGNVYWISLVVKLRHLLGEHATETVAA